MGFFGPPNVEKMKAKHDTLGLIKALNYQQDVTVRYQAAIALGEIRDIRAVEPLIAITSSDTNSYVRQMAIVALGQLGDIRAVQSLSAALHGSNPEKIREVAVVALGQIGDNSAIKPLIGILKYSGYKEIGLRNLVAETLKRFGSPAVDLLIRLIKGKNSRDIRITGATALGTIGDARAIEPLICNLKDNDDEVRSAAFWALNNLKWTPSDDENGAWYWVQKRDWERCKTLGVFAIEPLITAFKMHGYDVADPATEALIRIGTPAVELLIAALKDREWYIKMRAAWALGCIRDSRAVDPLIITLQADSQTSGEVRQKVVVALGMIGDTRAVDPLVNALKDDDCFVRAWAAEGLGKIGDSRAVEPLKSLLNDSYPRVIEEAVKALEALGWKPD